MLSLRFNKFNSNEYGGEKCKQVVFYCYGQKACRAVFLENLNPSMLKLQQSCQPEQPVSETLHALGYVKNKVKKFFEEKNEATFINMMKTIYLIPYFAESIDVSEFDILFDFYDSGEPNADIEDYFCRFPEYNRYMGYNIYCGPTSIYQYTK